jgi:hypothetical protein
MPKAGCPSLLMGRAGCSLDCFACTQPCFNTGTPRQAEGAWKGEGSSEAVGLRPVEKNLTEACMNGDDVLYSTVGRARRGNTESTTGKSSPPGRRFRGQRVSSFVHGFGRGGEGSPIRSRGRARGYGRDRLAAATGVTLGATSSFSILSFAEARTDRQAGAHLFGGAVSNAAPK